MTIISRYLFSQFAKSSMAVLFVLMVMMLGNTLIKLLEDAADGELASQYIWPLLGLSLVNYLVVFLGVSVYLGIIMAFGRMYKDSEMAAMVSCGVRPWDFIKPILMVTVPVVLTSGFLTLFVVPNLIAYQSGLNARADQIDVSSVFKDGEFNKVADSVLFTEQKNDDEVLSDKSLNNVFMYRRLKDGSEVIQLANQGEVLPVDEQYELRLYNGAVYESLPDQSHLIIEYKNASAKLPTGANQSAKTSLEGTPTSKLLGSDNPKYIAELQWRLSLPLAGLLLFILAFPLSHTAPRKGAFSKLAYGVLVYVVYSNLLSYAKTLVESGKVSPMVGMWWAHIPVIIFTLALFAYRYGWVKQFLAKTKRVNHAPV